MTLSSARDTANFMIVTHNTPRTHAAKEFADYMRSNRSGLTIQQYAYIQTQLGHRIGKVEENAILGDKDFLRFDYVMGTDGVSHRTYFPRN